MINYLIVDDETVAHEIIKEYSEYLPHLKLVKSCYNAFEAVGVLSSEQVGLVFLDIHMPKINGFEMLRSLSHPPKVIVTTAHHEFAVESYELEVVDYLLKPFGFDRFLKAVNKIGIDRNIMQKVNVDEIDTKESIFLKDGKRYIQVSIADILYIEAYGNYNKVVTKNGTVTTLKKLTDYLEELPKNSFIQVHKSYIVSLPNVSAIETKVIKIGERSIPIGQTYRKALMDLLK